MNWQYCIQVALLVSPNVFVNRSGEDANNSSEKRGVSTITVMEVSG